LIVAAQNRLKARKRAGVVSDEALSSTMIDYIQAVRCKSGELNVGKLKKYGTCRGAPIGNTNRVTHGKRKGEIQRLCADIRAHIHGGRDLVSRVISQGGSGSTTSVAALPRHKSKVSRHRFKLKLSKNDLSSSFALRQT